MSASGTPDDERVRLFVALDLPEEVRETLARWRSGAVRGIPRLRLIPPEDLHVTLCFLGWCYAGEVTAIDRACAEVGTGYAPVELSVARAIWLPPRRPRVLTVALTDPENRLARAQAALSETLERGGWYTPEKRRFLPHVTVARLTKGARAPRTPLPAPPPISMHGSRLTLYRSRLRPTGAQYEPLGSYRLGGDGASPPAPTT